MKRARHPDCGFFRSTTGPVLLLGEFFSAPEIFTFRQCSLDLKAVTEVWRAQRILSRRVGERLETLLPATQTHDFLEVVRRHGGVVSGSAVLAALTDASWNVRDLDVFFDDQPSFAHELAREFGKVKEMHQAAARYGWLARGEVLEPAELQMQIQLLFTKSPVTWHIANWFDMSFLKNTYDGRSLVVHDMQAVRRCHTVVFVNGCASPYQVKQRIITYEKRGFTFDLEEVPTWFGDPKSPARLPAVELRSGPHLIGTFVKFGNDIREELIAILDGWLRDLPELGRFRRRRNPHKSLAQSEVENNLWRGLANAKYIVYILRTLLIREKSVRVEDFQDIMDDKLGLN